MSRSHAPDLARGAMLLLIAIANAPWYLSSPTVGAFGHPADAGGAERVLQFVQIATIDGRVYPLFAFLFGYGLWQFWASRDRDGMDPVVARGILFRRGAILIAIGFAHAALLFSGDVAAVYGIMALILAALFIDRSDRTLWVWVWVIAGIAAATSLLGILAGAAASALGMDAPVDSSMASMATTDYLSSVFLRLAEWAPLVIAVVVLSLTVPLAALLGMLAARRRVLDDPARHRGLLGAIAAIGIALGWGFGAVSAFQFAGPVPMPAGTFTYSQLHSVSGVFAGVGYAALIGLAASLPVRWLRPIGWMLRAVGKRSLSCYVAQSVVFAPVMSAWGLGLGAQLTQVQITLWAVGTWFAIALLACVCEAVGVRGPLEALVRAGAYRGAGPGRGERWERDTARTNMTG